MKLKLITMALSVITAIAGASDQAQAGKRKQVVIQCSPVPQECCHPVMCLPLQCFPAPAQCAPPQCLPAPMPVSAQETLEPMEFEETYTVQVPYTEQIVDENGNVKTITKMRSETKTRTVVVRSANGQINALRKQLDELESKKVNPLTPLSGLVKQIVELVGPDNGD